MRYMSAFVGSVVAPLFIVSVFCSSLAAREVAEKDKRRTVPAPKIAFCNRHTVAADTVNRLLKTFPKGAQLYAEAFEGDEAQLFLEVFGGMFPTLPTPPTQTVATFSGQGISVLFFLQYGCLVGEHSVNLSAYQSIKAVMHSRTKKPVP